MVDKLDADQREVGEHNYHAAVGAYYENQVDPSRRDFLRGIIAAGAVTGAGLGAAYFGYGKVKDPVRVAVIGTGDEGNVLIGGCNPEYVDVKVICDIRPFSIHRAFHGDWSSASALVRRPGLLKVAGYANEKEAKKNVKIYNAKNSGITECLNNAEDDGVEAGGGGHGGDPVNRTSVLHAPRRTGRQVRRTRDGNHDGPPPVPIPLTGDRRSVTSSVNAGG